MTRCLVCGSVATLLCDFPFGGVIGGIEQRASKPYIYIDATKMPYRCDMPLCESCATHAGNIIICGSGGAADSVDYCPVHKGGENGMREPITPQRADSMRRAVWAQVLRGRMHTVRATTASREQL